MNFQIRPFNKSDINDLVRLSLLAFEPVFLSFEKILGPKIYPIIYPDWRKSQKEAVEKVCNNEKITLWVAEVDGNVAGYVAYELMTTINPGKSNCLQSILIIKTTALAQN